MGREQTKLSSALSIDHIVGDKFILSKPLFGEQDNYTPVYYDRT